MTLTRRRLNGKSRYCIIRINQHHQKFLDKRYSITYQILYNVRHVSDGKQASCNLVSHNVLPPRPVGTQPFSPSPVKVHPDPPDHDSNKYCTTPPHFQRMGTLTRHRGVPLRFDTTVYSRVYLCARTSRLVENKRIVILKF